MARFFVTAIEQMDLAFDQLAIADVNYKRFALMLIDNVVELFLHRHAKEIEISERSIFRAKKYPERIVANAVGSEFEDKVKLAKLSAKIDDPTGTSILTLHSFRNQAYHQGEANDLLLTAFAGFYFALACDLFIDHKPRSFRYSSKDVLPLRVIKHVGGKRAGANSTRKLRSIQAVEVCGSHHFAKSCNRRCCGYGAGD